jgi:hypothetical protein
MGNRAGRVGSLTLALAVSLAAAAIAQRPPAAAAPPPQHQHESPTAPAPAPTDPTGEHDHSATTAPDASTAAGGGCSGCCGGCAGCGGTCGANAAGHAGDAGPGTGGSCHGGAAAGAHMGRGGGMGHRSEMHGGSDTGVVEPLDAGARAALERAYADELRAEAMYRQVLADLGAVRPFAHTAHAESRHSEMILGAFRRRGEEPPAKPVLAAPPRFASVTAACAGAVRWEEENVTLYDELLALELPADVRAVLEHNRIVSLEHHLPAFRRCAGSSTGG